MKKSIIVLGLMACSGLANAGYPTLEEVREYTDTKGDSMVCGMMGVAAFGNEGTNPADKHLYKRLKVIYFERFNKMTQTEKVSCEDNFQIGYITALREKNGGPLTD